MMKKTFHNSKDPDFLTVDDYIDMGVRSRSLLDDWLKSIGCPANKTKNIRIDHEAKTIVATQFVVENNGKRYTTDTILGTEEITYHYDEEPPAWKV